MLHLGRRGEQGRKEGMADYARKVGIRDYVKKVDIMKKEHSMKKEHFMEEEYSMEEEHSKEEGGVSERRKALLDSNQWFQLLNDNIPGGIAKMWFDNGLIIEYANDTLYQMIHLTREEMRERNQNHYEKLLHKESWEELERLIEKSIHAGSTIKMESRVISSGKRDKWCMIQASVMEVEGEKPVLLCVITDITGQKNIQLQLDSLLKYTMAGIKIHDIDEQKRKVTELLGKIRKDSLTGYFAFAGQGGEEWARMDQKFNFDELTGLLHYQRFIKLAEDYLKENGPDGVFCVNFDFSNFQYINEVYGYEEGDKVLRTLADALQTECTQGIFFSRITSDFFVGLIRDRDVRLAQRNFMEFIMGFCYRMNQKYELCNLMLVSGLYEITGMEPAISAIVDCANEARKKCKEQGMFAGVMVYNEQIRLQSESSKMVVTNMIIAMNNEEFHAYLQPKVSLETGKIVGAEALVRWIRSDGTMIMPDQFVPIFEKNGFITRIDFRVLEQVMEYLKDALAIGEEVVPVSVNFSRRHNEFDGFIPSFFKRLDQYDIPADLIEAEVTESIFLADLDKLKKNLASLRYRGIQIAIDDFGSGYSSLNVLTKVAVDIIKLDGQFLNYSQEESRSTTVIKHLILMLKHLGCKVVAEGVETEEQVEMLKEATCDMVQGYYYAKPMPIKNFRQFLKEFNSKI